MAHLIEASGGGELVARVARERNGAFMGELAGDPELVGWLDRNGISLAEAAAIQPRYEGDPPDDGVEDWFALASMGASFTDVAAIAVNRHRDAGAGAAWFALIAGAGSIFIGAAPIHSREQPVEIVLSVVNVGMGLTVGLLGLRNLGRDSSEPRPSPPGRRLTLAPAVGPVNGLVLHGEF